MDRENILEEFKVEALWEEALKNQNEILGTLLETVSDEEYKAKVNSIKDKISSEEYKKMYCDSVVDKISQSISDENLELFINFKNTSDKLNNIFTDTALEMVECAELEGNTNKLN